MLPGFRIPADFADSDDCNLTGQWQKCTLGVVGAGHTHEKHWCSFPLEGAVCLGEMVLIGILPGKALNIEI